MKIKKECLNCGNEFEVEYKHRNKKYCNRNCYIEYARNNKKLGRNKDLTKYEIRNCLICNSEFEVRKKVDKKLCSDECRIKWGEIEENKNSRISKSKKVLNEKYGVDSYFKLNESQNIIKEKLKNKYGVSNPMHIPESVNKLKKTLKNKQIDKLLPKLKSYDILLLDEYTINKDNKNNTSISYRFKCLKCDNIFSSTVLGSGKIPICRKCNPIQKNSSLEIIITDFLTKYNILFKTNDRTILNGKEIDILIPSHNIAIEINGNYWHTENFGGKDKYYHIEKTRKCHSKGIRLIHIFEDELLFKKDIVFSRLKNILGLTENKLHARKCIIKEVSYKDKKEFLDINHIQGNSIDKIRLGLYYNDELVSLMTFSKERISLGKKHKNGVWELNRFSSKLNYIVNGGFNKLLNYFIENYKPNKIITYADIRWSGLVKNVYNNKFKLINETVPNYWYVKIGQYLYRYHRFQYRKDILVKEGYDPKKTEWEIMKENGFDRIWDCGNIKFELLI